MILTDEDLRIGDNIVDIDTHLFDGNDINDDGENNEFNVNIDVLEGSKKKLNEYMAGIMIEFINLIGIDKKSISYSQMTLREHITRAKDNEKDDIVEEIGELEIEERAVERLFMMHKIGKWKTTKTTYIHDNAAYDLEIEQLEKREARRAKLTEEGVSSSNLDIIADEEEARELREAEIDAEEYSLDDIPEDDDFGDLFDD